MVATRLIHVLILIQLVIIVIVEGFMTVVMEYGSGRLVRPELYLMLHNVHVGRAPHVQTVQNHVFQQQQKVYCILCMKKERIFNFLIGQSWLLICITFTCFRFHFCCKYCYYYLVTIPPNIAKKYSCAYIIEFEMAH